MLTRSVRPCFGGTQGFYEAPSEACGGPMRFGVFLPPAALTGAKVPAVYCLAGLECNEETFASKAGAQRAAARLGLALVTCDTSPRSVRLPGDDAAWDFGQGAGFYLDATAAPWSSAYRMFTHVVEELPAWVEAHFPVRGERALMGHSMGGHGALVAALRRPERYRSVSAFAPICAPSQVPWGRKAFAGYLGNDMETWAEWDACALLAAGRRFPGPLLVDQGLGDRFLTTQLRPELLEAAAAAAGQPLELRRRADYDHAYYFIASFVDEHLAHHAAAFAT